MQNRMGKYNDKLPNGQRRTNFVKGDPDIMEQVHVSIDCTDDSDALIGASNQRLFLREPTLPSNATFDTEVIIRDSRADMHAHLQKFQSFWNAWVVRQEELLLRVDNAGAATDDAQQQVDEVGASPNVRSWLQELAEDAPQKVVPLRVTGTSSKRGSDSSQKMLKTPSTTSDLESGPQVASINLGDMMLSLDESEESEEAEDGFATAEVETDFGLINNACHLGEEHSDEGGYERQVSPAMNHKASRRTIASDDLNKYSAAAYIGDDTEVRRRGKVSLENIVGRKGFELVCGLVIFSNAIVIGMTTDYAMNNPLSPVSDTLSSFELAFIIFYTVEMCLRMCVKGRLYFTERGERNWNLFDVILVVHGIWEQVVSALRSDGASALTNLRLFRLMKLVKLLRMVRLLRMFKELRLILSSISGCLISMLWAGLLILGISYVFGIAIVQGCIFHVEEQGPNLDPIIKEGIDKFWSSTATAGLSLYMSSTGGEDWIKIAMPLREVGGFFYALFLLYIAIFVFVVMNIINSIFLEAILSHAEKDHQLIIETQMEKKEEYVANLQTIFQDMDVDGDGEVTYDEFCQQLYCPRMQAFVTSLEMEITDAKKFFEVLSDRGRRPVDIATFVVGCIKLRGPAKSVDLADLALANKKAHHEQHRAFQQIAVLHKSANERRVFDQRVLGDFDRMLHYIKQLSTHAHADHLEDEIRDRCSEVDVSPDARVDENERTNRAEKFPL